jgi:hypothetical protein
MKLRAVRAAKLAGYRLVQCCIAVPACCSVRVLDIENKVADD